MPGPRRIVCVLGVLALLGLAAGGAVMRPGADRAADAGPQGMHGPHVSGAAPARPPPLHWDTCPDLPGGVDPGTPGLTCARLTVPLDHARPDGEQIHVAVSRLSTGPGHPVLVSNPGGPGATGLFNTMGVDAAAHHRLRQRYDLIGFDPRGVNLSEPVDCRLGARLTARQAGTAFPSTFGRDVADARETARLCAASSPRLLYHVGTADVVRDLDLLRKALHRQRISVVGTSYGAEIATRYATLYPDHTGRVVLDSPSDPMRPWSQARREQAVVVERRFDQIAARIAAAHGRWHLGDTARKVRERYLSVARRLQADPVRVGGQVVDRQALEAARLLPALGDDGSVDGFALTLQYLAGAPGAPTMRTLVATLDEDDDRTSSAPVNGQELQQAVTAGIAVRCADESWPRRPSDYRRQLSHDRRVAPVSRGAFATVSPCAFWPRTDPEARPPVTDRGWSGAPNVLVLHHALDYRSPARGVRRLVGALGRRAVVAEQPGAGHVLLGSDRSATALVERWLLDDRFCRDRRACATATDGLAGR